MQGGSSTAGLPVTMLQRQRKHRIWSRQPMFHDRTRWFLAALFVSFAIAAGYGARGVLGAHPLIPDAQWHKRELVEGHLAHWLAVAPTDNGFLRANVTRTWQPREQKTTDLVAQSRLVYVLLSGYEVTGDRRYLDAGRRGADFLVQYFPDAVQGGLFRIVDAQGRVANDSKRTYGHAFAIFALAHAYRVTKDERYRQTAVAAWRAASAYLRDPRGRIQTRGVARFHRRHVGSPDAEPHHAPVRGAACPVRRDGRSRSAGRRA
jgi:cellobiose epimerase